jgi:hypothetical protein
MPKTDPEKNAYAKGYSAGRRKAAADARAADISAEKEAFRRQAALMILPAIMDPGLRWGRQVNGAHKEYSTLTEFAEAAFSFADEMVSRTHFSGRTLPDRSPEDPRHADD